jgi:hypothetical protein
LRLGDDIVEAIVAVLDRPGAALDAELLRRNAEHTGAGELLG